MHHPLPTPRHGAVPRSCARKDRSATPDRLVPVREWFRCRPGIVGSVGLPRGRRLRVGPSPAPPLCRVPPPPRCERAVDEVVASARPGRSVGLPRGRRLRVGPSPAPPLCRVPPPPRCERAVDEVVASARPGRLRGHPRQSPNPNTTSRLAPIPGRRIICRRLAACASEGGPQGVQSSRRAYILSNPPGGPTSSLDSGKRAPRSARCTLSGGLAVWCNRFDADSVRSPDSGC